MITMKRITMLVVLLALCAAGFATAADEVTGLYKFEAYNASPLIRVKYHGPANTVATFDWDANAYLITEGSFSASNNYANADTVAIICGEINAWTNLTGKKNWTAYPCAALSTDDIDENDVTAASAAIDCSDGAWHEAMTVDTTALDYFDVCPWQWEQLPGQGNIILKSIYGAPGGTGPRVNSVYVNDELIWQTTMATNVPAGTFDTIDIGREFTADGQGLRISRGSRAGKAHVVVRCNPTTGTDSGGIGVSYSQDK